MLTIRIIQRGDSIASVIAKYHEIYDKLMHPDPTRSVKRVAERWGINYRQEGRLSGGWANLAERTIEDRTRLGFGSEHPILIREGSLYSMSTLWFMQGQSGSASSTSSSDGRSIKTTARLDISSGLAVLGLTGAKAATQQYGLTGVPARPYWFTDRDTVLAARLGVIEWITQEVVN